MSELRQIPRWQIGEKARLKLKGYDWEGKCCIEDLNLKGIKISSKERLPENSLLEFVLDLKSYLMLNVEARICWNKEEDGKYFYGMEFSRIKDQDKEEISQYLSRNCFDQFKEKWWPQEEDKG